MKEVIKLFDVDFEKILVSDDFAHIKNKETHANYFIGYKNDKKIKPLFIKFSQMTGFFNKFEKAQYMSFAIKDKKVLGKYKLIWNMISSIIGKTFDKQPIYDGKYLITKSKPYTVNTDFQKIIQK